MSDNLVRIVDNPYHSYFIVYQDLLVFVYLVAIVNVFVQWLASYNLANTIDNLLLWNKKNYG